MFALGQASSDCWTCIFLHRKCDRQAPVCSVCVEATQNCLGFDQIDKTNPSPGDLDGRAPWNTPLSQFVSLRGTESKSWPDNALGFAADVEVRDDMMISPGFSLGQNGKTIDATNDSLIEFLNLPAPSLSFHGPDSREETGVILDRVETSRADLPSVETTDRNDANYPEPQVEPDLSKQYERETHLLMHYLDHTFYDQFPAYRPAPSKGGRNWLLHYLTSSRPVYYATLCLSAFDRSVEKTASSRLASNSNEHETYYDTACELLRGDLQKLSSKEQTCDATTLIHLSLAAMQMISYESRRASQKSNGAMKSVSAEVQINSHSRHAPILFERLVALHTAQCQTETSKRPVDYPQNSLSTDATAALQFLSAVFLNVQVTIDIYGGVESGQERQCHELLHDASQDFQLEIFSGCQSWAMMLVVKVLALQRWKQVSHESQRLSRRELAKRAGDLEDSLARRLEENPGFPNQDDQNYGRMSRIYANSAIAFLYVVVCEYDADVVEVKDCVARTICDIKAFTDRKMLANLAWPICTISCLASSEQKPYFQSLMAHLIQQRPFRFSAAVVIMKKAWALREQKGTRIDWSAIFQGYDLTSMVL